MGHITSPVHSRSSGFTMIELVTVIIILGIVAAVTIPRFVGLSEESEIAVYRGAVGGPMSTSSILLAGSDINGTNNAGTLRQILENNVPDGWQAGISNDNALEVSVPSIDDVSTSFTTPDFVDRGLAQAP